MDFQQFDDNYKRITEEIARAAEKSGRKPEEITLLGATKKVPVELMNHAIQRGLRCIGENRVQEFLDKYDSLHLDQVDCHFIGRLQTNKIKYIIDKVSLIQSVDSMKLLTEIAKSAIKRNLVMDILIEVNIGNEPSKGGIMPLEIYDFIEEARTVKGIRICGLMTIPPVLDSQTEQAKFFDRMREYYVDITAKKLDNVCMNYLSMGMSDDFALAIERGANMVRIGSALFGNRTYAP